ncbi:nuclease-related domain-containing protein [Ureibacillus sp. MALMAid1270]|uniref:nuclease-related domain-containing protein n=1 Tax=Ureibacillus sp. MALMAid1270 TaxID=3411629 RepID=UPI003BA4C87C
MIIKNRKESEELQLLRVLDQRMTLAEKDRLHYYNLKKGYEGELMFDSYLVNLQCDCLIINDLLFTVNQKTFQLDSLILKSDTVFVFEIKNFEGDFYYDSTNKKIFPMKSKEVDIVNPIPQLMRSESLLSQMLHKNGFKYPIKSFVVFINPEFTLYQSPMDKSIIFSSQINRFLQQFDSTQSRITKKDKLLAQNLLTLHLPKSPYSQIPEYDYEQLKKGITCAGCGSFLVTVEGRRLVCLGCGHSESVTSAVLRSVREFRMLFPERRITTSAIYDWCRVVESRKSIRNILENNFKAYGIQRWTYYE